MTAVAQSHEILLIMCPAFCERNNVVHLLCLGHPAFLVTLLAVRVASDVSVADTLPHSSVASLGHRVSSVAFVVSVNLFHVLRAERLTCGHEIRTARVAARLIRFVWHG